MSSLDREISRTCLIEESNTMSSRDVELVAANQRYVTWLHGYSAKELACWFGAAVRTAKGWLAGTWPEATKLILMIARWGMPFVNAVFGPLWRLKDESLSMVLERMQLELNAINMVVKGGRFEGITPASCRPRRQVHSLDPGSLRLTFSRRREAPGVLGRSAAGVVKAGLVVAALCGTAGDFGHHADYARGPRAPRPPVARLALVKVVASGASGRA